MKSSKSTDGDAGTGVEVRLDMSLSCDDDADDMAEDSADCSK